MYQYLFMTRCWKQALFAFAMTLSVSSEVSVTDDTSIKFVYEVLELKKSVFGEFSMLMQERDDYATTITHLALLRAHAAPENEENMGGVRRLISLALHLSPRNRSAVVANHQLGQGLLPEKKEVEYSATVFARLLLTRGRLLKEQKNGSDDLVGRYFVELSAQLDPRNEDAVYESELQKIDDEKADWSLLSKNSDGEG